jgi:hypothetical protein
MSPWVGASQRVDVAERVLHRVEDDDADHHADTDLNEGAPPAVRVADP